MFTRALTARGVRQQDLALIELEPHFAVALQNRYLDAHTVRIDAARLWRVDLFDGRPAGAVISGLPLLAMPSQKVLAVLISAFRNEGRRSLLPIHIWPPVSGFSHDAGPSQIDRGTNRRHARQLPSCRGLPPSPTGYRNSHKGRPYQSPTMGKEKQSRRQSRAIMPNRVDELPTVAFRAGPFCSLHICKFADKQPQQTAFIVHLYPRRRSIPASSVGLPACVTDLHGRAFFLPRLTTTGSYMSKCERSVPNLVGTWEKPRGWSNPANDPSERCAHRAGRQQP